MQFLKGNKFPYNPSDAIRIDAFSSYLRGLPVSLIVGTCYSLPAYFFQGMCLHSGEFIVATQRRRFFHATEHVENLA